MESQSIIILVLLISMIGFAAWWHVRENKKLAEFLDRKKIDDAITDSLMHFAWSRTIQLLGTAAFAIIVIVAYDWKYNEASNLLYEINDILEKQQAANEAKITQQKAALALKAPETTADAMQPQPSNAIPNQGITPTETLSQPTIPAAPQPALYTTAEPVVLSAPSPTQQTIPASEGENTEATEAIDEVIENSLTSDVPTVVTHENAASTLEQVYNPEREQSAEGNDQASMDDMKKRYEDILVIYMFLKQCGRIQSADYNIITSALSQEMASVNAPGRLQADIVAAAKGSYQEIYSQSPCDGTGINKLLRQYTQYIEVLKTNFPPE